MSRVFKILCIFCALAFVPQLAGAFTDKGIATLRVMDKAAGKTQLLTIPLNQDIQFDNLILNVRNCKQSDPFDAENFFVFLEIYTKTDGRIFSGWMNRNEPGQNPLQNDIYDVWVEKCE